MTKQLAMEYLVAAYGPDKLNDPAQAEPILRRMIEIDPTEPSNYTYLSRIYEQNGDYEQAEQLLVKARDMKAERPGVYMTLAGFYNRQGEFDKTMEALQGARRAASRTTPRPSTRSPATTGRRRTATSRLPRRTK